MSLLAVAGGVLFITLMGGPLGITVGIVLLLLALIFWVGEVGAIK